MEIVCVSEGSLALPISPVANRKEFFFFLMQHYGSDGLHPLAGGEYFKMVCA